MSIRIVTHCYAKQLKQYAVFLRYHLSSLVLYELKVPITVSIAYATEDDATCNVLDAFSGKLQIDLMPMSPASLFRRSIGRNRAALNSYEDLIWFCDVDHVFGPGCLDALWRIWNEQKEKPTLMYPRELQIHQSHAIGDAILEKQRDKSCDVIECDFSQFEPKRYNRAIGGVQIANGAHCRKWGYLNDNRKYQTDRSDGIPFGDFRDDVAFRHQCRMHGKVIAIDLPALYRMRHTLTTY